jgi:hypothetical protein
MPKALIGWDLSRSAGNLAKALGETDRPGTIPLFQRVHNENFPGLPTAGNLYPAVTSNYPVPATQVAASRQIDIFNLDPRLTLVATFYRQLNPSNPSIEHVPTEPIGNLTGTVSASALVRSTTPGESDRAIYAIPAGSLFAQGGALDDGCEVVSGMQGIRFTISAQQNDWIIHHDIVATLVAIPNVSLGCVELAEALIRRLVVVVPEPFLFYALTFSPP